MSLGPVGGSDFVSYDVWCDVTFDGYETGHGRID
jgi:hypothetical protein